MSFHELAKRGFSASTDQSEVDTVSDAPPNLIGECFAVTYQKTDKVDMSSSKFETHARKHVEGLTRNDDVASLLALYQVRVFQSPRSASLIAHTRTRRDYYL
jgi:hypothetical protein